MGVDKNSRYLREIRARRTQTGENKQFNIGVPKTAFG
jgi:hypothetical protein